MEFIKREPKIFVLSGIARSGKDTVAEIIKDYYKNKKTIIISFGHYIKDYVKRISTWDGSDETKPRELLQQIGIELIKNKIDDKLFIKRIKEDITIFSYFYDIIVVDDARLVDELEFFKENYDNITTIKVSRENFDNGLDEKQKTHLTETDFENYKDFDYIIDNIGNYDKLVNAVYEILNEV